MVAFAVTTLAGTLLTILPGTAAIRPGMAPLLPAATTTVVVPAKIALKPSPATVPLQVIAAPVRRPALRLVNTDRTALAVHDLRFLAATAQTRGYDAGSELPHFVEAKVNRDSNSVQSLRLSTMKRFGGGPGDPIATRLQLRLTGDARSLDADLRVRGSVADAITRSLTD